MEKKQKEKHLQPQNISEEESLRQRAWIENKKMWKVAGPAIFTRFSTIGIIVVSQSFIGNIGSTELAAYALVHIVLIRFANGVLLGMASALQTLCGQAYGAKQYEMLGVYLQRSWIVLFLTSILLLPLYIFTTPILVALGQEKHIAEIAGSISIWSIGIIFAFVVSFTCQMFLQAQSRNKIIAYLAVVSISIHVFLSWLLTVKYKFGLNGAMTSIILAYWIPNFGQLVFIMNKCPETWKGFSFVAFNDLWPVIKLSLSSGAMLCLELWYNTILVILTGNMVNAKVSIDAIWPYGMASALATLCGQAYGAQQYDMLGIYLQRSWIVLFLTSILLLPIYIFTTPILVALGQDRNIAQVARSISIWSIGIIFAFGMSFTCQMFLQAQSRNKIIAYLAAFSISFHVFLSWLLAVKYKFGLNGAMTSIILAYWIPNFGQLVFIMNKCPETWKGFSFVAFKDLWPVIKLSLSSGVMLCLEVWYNTVLILLTGNMENAEVSIDALAICLNINGWEMMIALGFFAAASVRVSNELGRGSSKGAKFSILITTLTSFSIGFVLFLMFLFLREKLAYIFTLDREVAKAVGNLSPLLSISMLLNSVQPVLSGVSVGAGWQSVIAYVNIGSYYLIGIPVGVVLGKIFHLQVKGVWIGMLFGVFVQTVILIIIILKTDWDKQVEIARNRVNKWNVVENDKSNNRTSISS